MSELIICFAFLAENAPKWIKSLDGLERKVKRGAYEVARIPVATSASIKRSGSNESIRPSQDGSGEPSTAMEMLSAPQPGYTDIALAQTDPSKLTIKRKRTTTSLYSTASLAHKYRSRNTIVVYYDSEVQKAFEQLVHNLNAARNYIRKARMSARMELMANEDGELKLEDFSIRSIGRNARKVTNVYVFPTSLFTLPLETWELIRL
jgi:hypothetical protein